MSLADLVLECRTCGGESLVAVERTATCTDCGTRYDYDPDEDSLVASQGGEEGRNLPERPSLASSRPGTQEAKATARFAVEEIPVRYHDGLLGFVEQRGPHLPGTLRLHRDRIEFAEDAGTIHTWTLLDVRAVQTASSSVQISPLGGGVVTFALADGSPRRWEGLLRDAVAAAWKAAGRGTVVEFQPRIRAE